VRYPTAATEAMQLIKLGPIKSEMTRMRRSWGKGVWKNVEPITVTPHTKRELFKDY
jgi:hypothetical protein